MDSTCWLRPLALDHLELCGGGCCDEISTLSEPVGGAIGLMGRRATMWREERLRPQHLPYRLLEILVDILFLFGYCLSASTNSTEANLRNK